MPERSFKAEVEHLRKGNGDTFTGEGILAITKALMANGVGSVGGYQGAPVSNLIDVLADAKDLMAELGVRFEANASEAAAAAAMLAASVHYPIRGAVTSKGLLALTLRHQSQLLWHDRRRADHRRRRLRRRLLVHAGAQPRLCDEITILDA